MLRFGGGHNPIVPELFSKQCFLDRAGQVPWWRKVSHLMVSMYCIFLILRFDRPWPLYQALAWLALFWLIEIWRGIDRKFNHGFFQTFGYLLRHQEQVRPTGTTWFCLSVVLVTFFVHDPIVAAACFVGWTFGDVAAEVFGRTMPSPRLGLSRKTWAGQIACFSVSLVAYLIFFRFFAGGFHWQLSLLAAVATSLAEAWPDWLDDNLKIPTACAVVFSIFAWIRG